MSECVVRMEMPSKDRKCQMADDIDGVLYCPVMKKLCRQPDNGEMPLWCPIICSLPEGHGRLVDADELRREMYHEAFETDTDMQKWDSGCWIRYKMFENTIGAVHTIVPAERSET